MDITSKATNSKKEGKSTIYSPPGKYFEEFNVGDEYATVSRTVTEADIVNFAGVSADFNQLHTDIEFAKKSDRGVVVFDLRLVNQRNESTQQGLWTIMMLRKKLHRRGLWISSLQKSS
jgi:acyl dehydratase